MAGLWYRAGTVSVTNGSKKVTGFGTKWKTSVSKPDKGHLVWGPDGKPYELDYVESDTVLYLVTAYGGVTASGMAYSIDITRSGTNSAFSRDLSAFVAYHQLQMDGWQQLLTGTGDVTLTAPDGTKLTVPSWEKIMNAGTGVVALAKADADRAKSEASKAAASATAAGDVVAASALPLPDVWAPLSDSLRLITGYGRDVLVGSDVVARMVNFSRSTTKTYWAKDGAFKVAAANEPAFELEGLLLEGQSQNLVVYSEGATFLMGNASFQAITNNVSGVLPMAGQRISFSVNNGETNANIVQAPITLIGGQTYTYSAHVKVEAGDTALPENCITIYAANGVNIGARTVIRKSGDGIYRVSVPFTVSGTGSQVVYIRITRIGPPSAVWTAVVGGVQVESLPFASSYIATTGAVATRAADIVTIPRLPNMGSALPASLTVAITFNKIGFDQSLANYILSLIDIDNADRYGISTQNST